MNTEQEPAKVVTANNDGETQARLEALAAAARRKPATLISKRNKLIDNLRGDLMGHGDSTLWKRFGDLILANVSSAERRGDSILVTDYFDAAAPTIEIEGDANKTLSEIAEGYFRRYVKARNAQRVVMERIAAAEREIKTAKDELNLINTALQAGDVEFLFSATEQRQKGKPPSRKKKIEAAFKGARRFVSSDGFEILVGKKAKDNDYLTFRLARSLDLWLHASDYPGSHVVIRNANRKVIPAQTLLEAAQLAAFYSDAREKPKAAVNYTQKKFVNKPKRAAPGLVSLASFKTILIQPQVPVGARLL